jgi:hypothetical protein
MKTKEAVKYFRGASLLASAINVTPAAISQWGKYPPDKRQLQIERISTLKAEPGCLDRLLGTIPDPQPWDGKTERRTGPADRRKAGAAVAP